MSLPKFDREHFRDHADPARIDRVWARIDADLPEEPQIALAPPARAPRSRTMMWLAAASLAAFAAGVVVGHRESDSKTDSVPVAQQTNEASDSVLAAGSRARTFALPDGGAVTLSPGGTIEVGEATNGLVTLRLVQGHASIETAAGGSLAIVAGEAKVSTLGAATLSVDRAGDAIDLAVSDGLVELEAPDSHRPVRSGERVRASTITPTAVIDPKIAPHPVAVRQPSEPGPLLVSDEVPAPAVAPAPVAAPATAGWFALYENQKYDDALAAVEQSGGAAAAIDRGRTARELMALEHLARKKGEKILAMRALTRVATEFPDDPNAKAAAMTLGNMHRAAGNDALAQQYYDLAQNSAFGEDIACGRLQAMTAASPGAEKAARDYLAKYDNGRCREAAEDLLGDIQNASGDDKAPDAKAPDAPPVDGSAHTPPTGAQSPSGAQSPAQPPSGAQAPSPDAPKTTEPNDKKAPEKK